MTDYERTTTHQTSSTDPLAPEPRADSVRTTERAYRSAGPGGATVVARFVTFLFVQLILNLTDPFVEPFRGMFALDRATAGRQILDIAAIVALIGWSLVELLILALVRVFDRRTVTEV
jgi:uncharacterized protein YggT (Ycf19 family)